MRRIVFFLLCLPALAYGAAKTPEGRWEGRIQIPGRELQLIVDLAQDSAGIWMGSVIIPGLGLKGAPLSNVVVSDADLSFDAGVALRSPTYGAAGFKAHLTDVGGMAGEMRQGGNVARFSLNRIASAQVELPPRSTSVVCDLEDQWSGEFELGGYPRHVTITLENHAGAAATAKFVVVGKQTTNLTVDLVIEEGSLLRIESQELVAFEGRFLKESGELKGTIELLSLELPLVLRRSSGRTS